MLYERILRDNQEYQLERQLSGVDPRPSERLTILTCMDVRIDTYGAFGLHLGEAHVLRNAGGRVTDDVMRSLVLSCHALGVREIGVVHHTLCGLLGDDGKLRATLEQSAGVPIPLHLHVIEEPLPALQRDVDLLRSCAYLPDDVTVWGARFDVETGHLSTVVAPD